MASVDHRPEVAPPEEPSPPTANRHGWSAKLVFFVVLLVVMAAYTQLAFQMDWVTKAGRIGPGYFPRIIGVAATLLAAFGAWHSWRHPGDESDVVEEEMGEGDLGRHPMAMLVMVLASLVLLVTLLSLGAIVASAVFMLAVLSYLNPGRWVTNLVLAVAVPFGLYLLFQTALNAGLPSGILPRF
ncbi:tripartite tricarboxylate transporter TctB family protein [Ornithinimicrobium cavernae]|uniref:tripartite tricarboxylate transporter TctB family protein n=1 Tax=Ornithinimicrobium cavernae TaxID=2666047 RepID=UPI000D69D9CE|nr:tripartite tricarboxylate transporter TctB family protein [Ornithinimicrobium cavernae]